MIVAAFRADASTQIGAGHIMRCLVLAQALKERGAGCFFITKDYPGNLINSIKTEGFEVEETPAKTDLTQDRELTADICRQHGVDVLITDSYALNTDYLTAIKKEIKLLISIDDIAQIYFPSDILLNQNFGVKKKTIKTKLHRRLNFF